MTNNMNLWNSVCTTPAEYLKQFTRSGGFSGKSIDPVYRIRKLTEMFGPVGKGWRFVVSKRWSENNCVYVSGHIWYKIGDEQCETCEHTGGTEIGRTPDEAYKMSETDALGKCALDIGIAADVYLGQHDGDKYQRPESPRQSSVPQAQQAAPRQQPQQPNGATSYKPFLNEDRIKSEKFREWVTAEVAKGTRPFDILKDLRTRYIVSRANGDKILAIVEQAKGGNAPQPQAEEPDEVPF